MGGYSTFKPDDLSDAQFLHQRVQFHPDSTVLTVTTVETGARQEAYFLVRNAQGFVTVYACEYSTGPAYPHDPHNFGWRDPWGEAHGIPYQHCPDALLHRLSPLPPEVDATAAGEARAQLQAWADAMNAHNEALLTARAAQRPEPPAAQAPRLATRDHWTRVLNEADPFHAHRAWRAAAWENARRHAPPRLLTVDGPAATPT
ncbi:hypothetical protein [Deinococcus enclensis]|uniref:Uncharacterized protein n=1 Tax=Deinococcus enclensis TaxID=1049582 RepID=A0ABT9MIW7_9DEIO|nr:hypothetical protein [Deinococcus enclensis]MDP9766537.1 hypothetical protein [Deinococcus enclensis]